MNRYIDADKLALHLSDYALQESPNWGANGYGNQDAYDAINECIKAIDNQPTADVVEIVRCKDCRWYDNHHLCIQLSRFGSIEPLQDFYCGFGERAEA